MTDEPLTVSTTNFNHFNQRMGHDNEQNQQIETRTVFYRMQPNNTSVPSNAMQSNAPIMMMGGMPRGPPRFIANNNNGRKPSKHFTSFLKYSFLFRFLFHIRRALSNASHKLWTTTSATTNSVTNRTSASVHKSLRRMKTRMRNGTKTSLIHPNSGNRKSTCTLDYNF